MARLVLVNGPPGVGKSTMARRYVEDHPLTLALDIDLVRGLLGGWRRLVHDAGLLARALSLSMARTHLATGHAVVIPQYLGRPDLLDDLERVAVDASASFHEVVLMDTREAMWRRFDARHTAVSGRGDAAPYRLHATPQELHEMYDRLLAILGSRPSARIVAAPEGRLDDTYRAVLQVLD